MTEYRIDNYFSITLSLTMSITHSITCTITVISSIRTHAWTFDNYFSITRTMWCRLWLPCPNDVRCNAYVSFCNDIQQHTIRFRFMLNKLCINSTRSLARRLAHLFLSPLSILVQKCLPLSGMTILLARRAAQRTVPFGAPPSAPPPGYAFSQEDLSPPARPEFMHTE